MPLLDPIKDMKIKSDTFITFNEVMIQLYIYVEN